MLSAHGFVSNLKTNGKSIENNQQVKSATKSFEKKESFESFLKIIHYLVVRDCVSHTGKSDLEDPVDLS